MVERRPLAPVEAPRPVPPPDPEVASDPERLRLWNKEQKEQKGVDKELQRERAQSRYHLSGCGHSVTYGCFEQPVLDEDGEGDIGIYCSPEGYPGNAMVKALPKLMPLLDDLLKRDAPR